MLLVRTTFLLSSALCLLAQTDTGQSDAAQGGGEYAGPAILSRGEVPGTPAGAAGLAFRPYIGLNGIYDTGLLAVGVSPTGQISTRDLYGVELNLGAYAYHTWKKTTLGLDYRGDFRHYTYSLWDSTNHLLALVLTHRPTKRTTFTLREQGGIYRLNYFLNAPLGALDPNYLVLPQNDIYDNRVIFASTSADLTYQLTRRLSFNMGGDGNLVRRQSSALYGVTGAIARGDLQYRVSRHTTIGADYRFTYFAYTRGFGHMYMHSVGLNYSTAFTRHLQLSARIGGARVESLSLTLVTLDPAIAALLGQSVGIQAAYRVTYVPDTQIRLTDTFRRSQFALSYANNVTPGNGVYLTSRNSTANMSYGYSGVRYWNFGVNATYSTMTPIVQSIGSYSAYGGGIGITRELVKDLHAVLRVDARRYDIANSRFKNTEYRTSLGLTFSPGDVPLKLW